MQKTEQQNREAAMGIGFILMSANAALSQLEDVSDSDELGGKDSNDPTEKLNKGDSSLGQVILDGLGLLPFIADVELEDMPTQTFADGEGTLTAIVDQWDGTKNGAAHEDAPTSSGIALVDRRHGDRLGNIVASAAVSHLTRRLYVTYRKEDGAYATFINGKPAYTNRRQKLDVVNNVAIVENYYAQTRRETGAIAGSGSGNYRSLGTALLEMCMMASASRNGLLMVINSLQKMRELSIALPIALGAGAVCTDFDGRSLLAYEIGPDLKKKVPIILACNPHVHRAALALAANITQEKR